MGGMITDEEIEQLPDDPELAFVGFEKILRERLNERIHEASQEQWGNTEPYYLEYINKVLAAARTYEISTLKDCEVPKVNSNIYQAYERFSADVDHFTTQIRIRRAGRNRQNSVGLDGNTKTKIHSYIQKIRIILDKAELPESKRDLLFSKLDAFVLEVDKARTNLQSVSAVYLTVCTVIGEGFNKLEPVRRFINSIAALIGKAKEAEDSLRALPSPTKLLESPRRQLPAPEANGQASDDKVKRARPSVGTRCGGRADIGLTGPKKSD
jgi:hypothetical protein